MPFPFLFGLNMFTIPSFLNGIITTSTTNTVPSTTTESELRHYIEGLRRDLFALSNAYEQLHHRYSRLERLIFDNKLSNDKIDAILKAFEMCQYDPLKASYPTQLGGGMTIINSASTPQPVQMSASMPSTSP